MSVDEARGWLADQGVRETAPGEWVWESEVHTANDVAHIWADQAVEPTPEGLRLGLGLLDLLDEYWVTCEIGFVLHNAGDPALWDLLWAAYRRRLEAPEPAGPVEYALWVDHFEDRRTVGPAWAAVLGDDVDARVDLLRPPVRRRVERVLPVSGPVPWDLKHGHYRVLTGLPQLHPALFRALLRSYHDYYGSIDPGPALDLLGRLRLPPGTEHVEPLRTVLAAGERNHHRNTAAWSAAKG